MTTTLAPRLDAEAIRRDFPILGQKIHGDKPLIYLDNAATTQRPRQVIDALVRSYEHSYANVHRGVHWLSDQSTDLFEEARERVRVFLNARERHEIIFTTGTTFSINLVARSWGDANLRAGDVIVLSEMEHHSNLVPWHQLCERVGCHIRTWPVTDTGELDMTDLSQLFAPPARFLALTAVSNVLGTINPVADIVRQAHAAGLTVLIDAAQAVPHDTVDVQAWEADFVAFSGHKLMGPSGVGVLYGKEAFLDAMPPFLGGGSMIRRVRMDRFEPGDLPAKFEAGTPPIVPAIGLSAALDYLDHVGLDNVARHERMLTEHAHALLLERLDGIRILGPACEKKGGIVSFVLPRVHAHDVAQLLDREGIAIRAGHHCAMPLHLRLGVNASNRASFYLYNSLPEVEAFVTALEQVAQRFFARRRTRAARDS